MPKPTEWDRLAGNRTPSGGKQRLPVCHLCGREFGTASLQIHLKACAQKYEREKGKPAPPAPEMLNHLTNGDRPISQADWDAYNEIAYEQSKAEMEPCPLCGRTFAAKDRLAVHMRSCQGPTAKDAERAKKSETKKSERGGGVGSAVAKLVRSASSGRLFGGGNSGVGSSEGSSSSSPPPATRKGHAAALQPEIQEPPARPAAAVAVSSGAKPTAKERLQEVKELLDAGFIEQHEYDAKRKEIIASL